MITIRDILNVERFSSLKLLNSNANIDREVSTIESTETPDVSSFLAENSLLLTTGMIYKDNQRKLSDLIIKLNNLPCAALAIKLGRFIDKLDDEVIETADRLNFPLIQIPINMTLGSISNQLLSYIWDNQNEQLLYALNTQKKFSNLMKRGASIQVLIRNLGNLIKKPVALIDPFGNINASNEKISTLYSKELIREIIEDLSKSKDNNKGIDIKTINTRNEEDLVSIYPVTFSNDCPYYLMIFQSYDLPFPLSAMAIEQATLILAFTLYKNLRIPYNLMSNKEEFLSDIINTKKYDNISDSQLSSIGSKFGLIQSKSYRILILYVENKDDYSEELYSILFEWLNKKLEKNMKNTILFPQRQSFRFIILLQENIKDIEEKLIGYKTTLMKTLKLNVAFALGNEVFEIDSIKFSYTEALEAMKDGETRNGINSIYYYKPLGTTELLKQIPSDQLKLFCEYTLKKLVHAEDENQMDLRNTLKTYLDFNCDITKTASELFIHRNTVKYRIKKCESILENDLTDPEFSLKLRIALKLTESN